MNLNARLLNRFKAPAGSKFKLASHDPAWAGTAEMKQLGKATLKKKAIELLEENRAHLADAQRRLYASDKYSVLVVLQAMDAAGKDGTI